MAYCIKCKTYAHISFPYNGMCDDKAVCYNCREKPKLRKKKNANSHNRRKLRA